MQDHTVIGLDLYNQTLTGGGIENIEQHSF